MSVGLLEVYNRCASALAWCGCLWDILLEIEMLLSIQPLESQPEKADYVVEMCTIILFMSNQKVNSNIIKF